MGAYVIAYGFDRFSGEYTGTVNAWEDQLDPGNYLLPANATFLEPPEPLSGKYVSFNGTAWTQVDIPTPPAPPTPPPPTADELRNERNNLLFASDWTQLGDIPLTTGKKAEWATYRQALRNVPQQPGFPTTVTWPTKPGA